MSKKLDPESLGIILLNAFIDEFFPEEKRSVPDTFDLLHYNGIPGSNSDNRVSLHPLNRSVIVFLKLIEYDKKKLIAGEIQ